MDHFKNGREKAELEIRNRRFGNAYLITWDKIYPMLEKKGKTDLAPKLHSMVPDYGVTGTELQNRLVKLGLDLQMAAQIVQAIDPYQPNKQFRNAGKYGVQVSVYGGVTGSRTALLKENGIVRRFDTREEAQVVATEYVRDADSRSMYTSARYDAKVVPLN